MPGKIPAAAGRAGYVPRGDGLARFPPACMSCNLVNSILGASTNQEAVMTYAVGPPFGALSAFAVRRKIVYTLTAVKSSTHWLPLREK